MTDLALFDLAPTTLRGTVVRDGITFDTGPGGTLLSPVCLTCGRPWQACDEAPCLGGTQRWEATSGLDRAGFLAKVTALVGGA